MKLANIFEVSHHQRPVDQPEYDIGDEVTLDDYFGDDGELIYWEVTDINSQHENGKNRWHYDLVNRNGKRLTGVSDFSLNPADMGL